MSENTDTSGDRATPIGNCKGYFRMENIEFCTIHDQALSDCRMAIMQTEYSRGMYTPAHEADRRRLKAELEEARKMIQKAIAPPDEGGMFPDQAYFRLSELEDSFKNLRPASQSASEGKS